jgi:predicted transcriptional regulator/DNA-binding XRE family transcriptional regulator
MSRDTLTGSRIRERRLIIGMKQADLARHAGVSASYLNLIEHNRRRIGGKLLLDIAAILDVEASVLSEGAETALLATLREVAALHPRQPVELDKTEEFAGRFPEWARLIDVMAQRQSSLEQTVVTLTDRMTHDPQLATALHDMLGAVTAIRSTSSILVQTEEIEPEWRDRFQRNINEDAQRLTEGSQALVAFLNGETSQTDQFTTPQDEIEAFFSQSGYYFPDLETCATREAAALEIKEMIERSPEILVSASGRSQTQNLLFRYWRDAHALPTEGLLDQVSIHGLEPDAIAALNKVDLGSVMRRLASIPGSILAPLITDDRFDIGADGVGLAVCDSSGTLTQRKPLQGFPLPRFGAACPLWSLYQSLSRPLIALREVAEQSGRDTSQFETLAFAAPVTAPQFGAVPLLEAHMLIVPLSKRGDATNFVQARPIGVSCRICPRPSCAGRREPSILASGL